MAHKKLRRRASKTTDKHAPAYVNDITASSILMIPAPTLRRWRHERRGPKFCKLEGLVRYCVTEPARMGAGPRGGSERGGGLDAPQNHDHRDGTVALPSRRAA